MLEESFRELKEKKDISSPKRKQWKCRLKSCSNVKESEEAPLCPKHQRRMILK